jgi:2-polyprenyl-3-methyl-5-hydroxy-6-metoxy-1,4-benzoquinol methylase
MPPDLDSIPRGNTCAGVNPAVVHHLFASGRDFSRSAMLDLPCGDGTLVRTLQRFFPTAEIRGADFAAPAGEIPGWFQQVDASRPFTLPGRKHDVICCVSGVMEFENTRQFFESCRAHLTDDGLFIVTNDNVVAVRDRLAYFAFGKARRFELFGAPDRPTWKFVPIQNLLRVLHDAGFSIRAVQYVGAKPKDWLLLPLALLLWPAQLLHREFARGGMPRSQRRAMLPFRSLICRHYLVFCEPGAASGHN